MGAWDVSKAV